MGSSKIFASVLGLLSLATMGAMESPPAPTIADILSNQNLILTELSYIKKQLASNAAKCSGESHEENLKGIGMELCVNLSTPEGGPF